MSIKHLYEDERPSLLLDFANSKTLDPRITFQRQTIGTYVDEQGVIKTAADNEARFDHDPATGECLGLLIEEERTNEALDSDLKSNWNFSPASNLTTEIGPDGTTVMELNGGTSGGTGNILCARNVTALNSGDYILSFFIKKPSGSTATFTYLEGRFFSGSTGGGKIHFDWSDNDWSFISQRDKSDFIQPIENYGNGWYRVGIKITLDSGDLAGSIRVGLSNSDNQNPGTLSPDNKILIWGAQFERGSFMTSYIPTSGSTYQRKADEASITGTDFSNWFNQSEGTLVIQASNVKEGKYCGAFTSGLTGTPDTLSIYRKDDDEWRIYHTSQVTFNATGDTANVAMGYSVNGTTRTASAAWKGTLISNVPTDSSHINFTSLQLGTGPKGAGFSNGHTSRLAYYNTRLTDATLEALTK